MLGRRVLLLGCLLAVFAVLALAVTGPVEALRRDGFTIKRGQTASKDFPALAGNSGPAGASLCGCTPPVCDTATYCDTIPVTIEVPALGPNDDFLVRITLTWDYQKVNGTSGNDLDLRVYDKQGRAALARAEGGGEPETVTLYRPTDGPYLVLVINATGPNTGYRLEGSMSVEKVTTPFEVGEDSGPPPQDLSGEPEPAPQQGGGPPPTFEESSPPLTLAPIDGDGAFEGLSEQSGQLGRLLTPPSNLLDVQEEDSRPPPPPSGLKLLFWAAFFPAILVALGFFWIKTRGAARLELA